LKPIDPKNLQENIEKLIEKIKKDEKYESMTTLLEESMDAYRKNFFYRLIYSKYIDQDYLKNTIHNLEFDQYNSFLLAKLELVETKERFIDVYNLLNLTENDFFNSQNGMAIIENEHRIVVMYMDKEDNKELFLEKTRIILEKYCNTVKSEYNIVLNVGLSNVHNSLSNYSSLLEEASCALENNLSFKGGGVYYYDENSFMQPAFNIMDIKEALSELITTKNSDEQVQIFIDTFCPPNVYANHYSVKMLCIYVFTMLQIMLIERNMAGDDTLKNLSNIWRKISIIDKIDDVKAWLSEMLISTLDLISSKEYSAHDKIIYEIDMQIHQNYNKITCMDQIATNLFISESYARRIYKQYTGKTIFEALFVKRMEEAKKLLVNSPEMRIYEIAAAVGYKSKQYFIEAFKRSEGCIPKDYRQKMLGDKN